MADNMPSVAQPGPLGPPPPEVTYANRPTLKAALTGHACENGFALTIKTSSPTRLIYQCSKSGKYNPKGKDKDIDPSKRRRNTGTTKTDCPFRVACYPTELGGWKVQISDCNHNHAGALSISALLQYRIKALSREQIVEIKGINKQGIPARTILSCLKQKDPDLVLIPKDVYNILAKL